jgi:hypothetical protein
MDIQHPDGSFDQAFPNEHSFGATAFLLHPLLSAYQTIRDVCPPSVGRLIENGLHRAAEFIATHDETHGYIANHLAGAVLSLIVSVDFFQEKLFEHKAVALLQKILDNQSEEGWFQEYEGADPGYQTLCMYYLAQVHTLRPDMALKTVLDKAIHFLCYFVHPDGTFGGEYSSRRTSIYYPGGLALLSREFSLARSMTRFMCQSINQGKTVSLQDMDMGNLAPLLSNYMLCVDSKDESNQDMPHLPFEADETIADFPQAGLHIRGTRRYYAIMGWSNGGVLKVFDKEKATALWNDGGYAGQLQNGTRITTQITDFDRPHQISPDRIWVETSFYELLTAMPTPFRFIILRLLNVTLMHNIVIGNWIKALLVSQLISDKKNVPLRLVREVTFGKEQVVLSDTIQASGPLSLRWLSFGNPFVGIHMASSRYYDGHSVPEKSCTVDANKLNIDGTFHIEVEI